MPKGALGSLLKSAAERVTALRAQEPWLEAVAGVAARGPSFAAALRAGGSVAVIAEIKRRSPSQGAIAPALSAEDQAKAYASGGAAAISVLTEPTQFGGALADLDAARAAGVPMLRKDFVVDRLQLLEAVAHGASAALLIVRALDPARLAALHAEGTALGLAMLVEVHDDPELDQALRAGYPLLGVNNRNLETLEIDPAACERMIPRVPAGTIAVYESGVQARADVARAAALGADAVLVGTALSQRPDPVAAVRELAGVPRHGRNAS